MILTSDPGSFAVVISNGRRVRMRTKDERWLGMRVSSGRQGGGTGDSLDGHYIFHPILRKFVRPNGSADELLCEPPGEKTFYDDLHSRVVD